MRVFLLFISLWGLSVSAQKLPSVNFNHFYAVIDSADLRLLQQSTFIKDTLAALATRTTKADNAETWTGTYLYGVDSYLELFDVSVGDPLGVAGLGLSVDGMGELTRLDDTLSKHHTTELHLREKQYDDKKVPWYEALSLKDADSLSPISYWVMEYKPEYFEYNHWKHEDKRLTRAAYLKQYEADRRNKILKRFTGVSVHATEKERQSVTDFLLSCGFSQINDSSLVSPEHFVIHFIPRNINDRYALASIDFETTRPLTDTIRISENIEVRIKKKVGKIIFK